MKKQVATAALAGVALFCADAGDARAQSDTTPPAQAAPQRATGTFMNIGFSGLFDAGWSTKRSVRSLQLGDHDPKIRGFSMPGSEISLEGTVDPYFKGFVNINYGLDQSGETGVELEEAYVLTTSLPKNLQVKAGQFLTDFGRQNTQHPHAWSFVDVPLAVARMFGADGLRGSGARVSWLLPTSFYTEAMVTVMNSAGETAYSFRSEESLDIHGGVPVVLEPGSAAELLYVPRLTTSLDLGESQTIVAGVSGAFGPNSGGADSRTAIFGADVYWKWKSLTAAQGFPFVSLQAEALMRSYDTDTRVNAADLTTLLPEETIKDHGGYAQLLWGMKPRVVLGLRGEAVTGDPLAVNEDLRIDRLRISPSYTWYPSEFSKIRLQYNYDDRKTLGRDHSLWLQFEFIMGAHAAHKF
jgi:hypothetical protein